MLHFDDIEELVNYMFEKVNTDNPITVAADKDLAVDIMTELLISKDVTLEFVDIDSLEYDKEYYVTLLYDEEEADCWWRVSVEKAYNDVRGEYFGMGGHILFHEDTNSKILVDIQNNESVEMSGHDWFIIGEDDSFETDEEEENDLEDQEDEETTKYSGEDSNAEYTVTVKCNVNPGDVVGLVRDVERSVLHMHEMFDEMNRFRRLFGW